MKNLIILIGRVGQDPEVRTFESGTKVANFSLATSKRYKKEGEQVEETQWHNIVIYRNLADVVEEYVKKGQLLYLEGEVKYRSYESDGQKKYVTDIVCNQMTMLGKNEGNQSGDIDGLPF